MVLYVQRRILDQKLPMTEVKKWRKMSHIVRVGSGDLLTVSIMCLTSPGQCQWHNILQHEFSSLETSQFISCWACTISSVSDFMSYNLDNGLLLVARKKYFLLIIVPWVYPCHSRDHKMTLSLVGIYRLEALVPAPRNTFQLSRDTIAEKIADQEPFIPATYYISHLSNNKKIDKIDAFIENILPIFWWFKNRPQLSIVLFKKYL